MAKKLLYREIADSIADQIGRKVWQVGDKLPSIRTVCHEYGVSMNTATRAYLELEKKALIESRPQSGFYVSRSARPRLAIPSISRPKARPQQEPAEELAARVFQNLDDTAVTRFSLGVPDDVLLPIARLNKEMIRAVRTFPGSGIAYGDIRGNKRLRRGIARWSFTWGSNLSEEDIVTTTGCMSALSYCLMALTKPGDTLAVESPLFFGVLQLARSIGLKVLELPTHPVLGIDPDVLKKTLPRIDVCLLVSNFNNPLGSCMPEEHKRAVVAMLDAAGIPLIEDDLYGDVYFGESRPLPCKAFDETGNVLWCGSVSKTLAPGYRVGWVAPGRYLDEIKRIKLFNSVSSPVLTEEAVGGFLETGRYEHHLRKLRQTLYTNSLQFTRAVADYFPEGTRVSQPTGGFVLWIELDKNIDTAELYDRAIRQGISIAPGRVFTLQDQFHHCMRVSYGLHWSDQLDARIRLLGKIVKGMG